MFNQFYKKGLTLGRRCCMIAVLNLLNIEVITVEFKIREHREAIGMTQEELAKASNVSRGTIVALESGKNKTTTTKTLDRIAKALGTTVDQIFFAKDV